jgi:hypothetical protein
MSLKMSWVALGITKYQLLNIEPVFTSLLPSRELFSRRFTFVSRDGFDMFVVRRYLGVYICAYVIPDLELGRIAHVDQK